MLFRSQTNSNPPSRYQSIEIKARQADARNRQSIEELAHEIVVCPHVYSMPDVLSETLESKLADAETNFRNGQGHAVGEQQLVDVLNWMGEKFHLPSYTKTTTAQVRILRMKLAIEAPYLMGSTLAGKELEKGAHVRAELSPVQAMHLLSVMIDQKVLNPDYQDPSTDIVASERQRQEEIRRKGTGKGGAYLTVRTSTKNQEVRNSIDTAAGAMNAQDAFDVMNHVFNTLHLD